MNNIQTSAITEIEKFNNYTTDLLMSLYPSTVFINGNIEENINNALTDPPYKDLKKQLSIFQENILNQISIEVNSNNITKIFDAYHPMFSMTRGMIKELNKISKTEYIDFYLKNKNSETTEEEIQNNQVTIKHFKDRGLSIQFNDYLEIIEEHAEICEEVLNNILLYLKQYKKRYIPKAELEYNSINRAVGICLRIAFENNKISEQVFYSTELYEYAKQKFNLTNGKRAGDQAKQANDLKELEIAYPKDYKHALKLYKEKFEKV